ncbi:MAG: ribonuclease H-like domain-containing protein [Chlorobia bacterium]|nr:ribonuclease H-like domain-containing protein [Fimbriimonadaceae bacterium]
MLPQTFIHIPGIGHEMEASLWKQGCNSWSHYLEDLKRFKIGSAEKEFFRKQVHSSMKSLEEGRHQFFTRGLGLKEAWRAFPDFRSSCVYLDIETDGGQGGSSVTMIGLYDGKEFQCLVKGDNLENFRDIISQYSMIVTFFGSAFDLPMLQKCFSGIRFDQIHLDLCPTLRRVDVRGGLKKIEKQLGIARGEDTEGLNGYDAILLWQRFQRNRDDRALEKLIAYNRDDVVNLEKLAEIAYQRLQEDTLEKARLF